MDAILPIVMRVLHIVAATLIMGGLCASAFVYRPTLATSEGEAGDAMRATGQRKFMKLMWIAVLLLLVTGIYNWVGNAGDYKDMGAIGNALIGVKVLFALGVFAVIGLKAAKIIRCDKAFTMIAVHLALAVIIVGGVLRHFRLDYLKSLIGG